MAGPDWLWKLRRQTENLPLAVALTAAAESVTAYEQAMVESVRRVHQRFQPLHETLRFELGRSRTELVAGRAINMVDLVIRAPFPASYGTSYATIFERKFTAEHFTEAGELKEPDALFTDIVHAFVRLMRSYDMIGYTS